MSTGYRDKDAQRSRVQRDPGQGKAPGSRQANVSLARALSKLGYCSRKQAQNGPLAS